jgi:hypothetical protein
MTYVPRSPRRATTLRAVVDGAGALHARGRVRDMSTSGFFVEGTPPAAAQLLGARIAVVPLVGDLDGERWPADVARVDPQGMAVRFVGLDAERRQRLRALLLGDSQARLVRRPSTMRPAGALPLVPADAPVVLLTDEASMDAPTSAAGASPARDDLREMEDQLVALGLRAGALEDDNRALAQRLRALEAKLMMRQTLEQELFDAYETVEDLERTNDTLVQALHNMLSERHG